MDEQELNILIRLKDEASAQLKQINTDIFSTTKSFITNYGALIGTVTGIVGSISAFASKAHEVFEDYEVSIARLGITLKNIGIDYKSVSKQIQDTTNLLTGNSKYAIDEMSNALTRLIGITGDYEASLKYLGLVVDIAAFKNIDLVSSAQAVAMAMQGNTRMLMQFGIQAKDISGNVASARNELDKLSDRLRGTAAITQTEGDKMSKSWKNLMMVIGGEVAPTVGSFEYAITGLFNVLAQGITAMGETRREMQAMREAFSEMQTQSHVLKGEWYNNIAAIQSYMAESKKATDITDELSKSISNLTQYIDEMGNEWKLIEISGVLEGTKSMGWSRTPVYKSPNISGAMQSNQNIQINVQGSVLSERDLSDAIRRQMLLIKGRNFSAGLA